MTSKMEFITAFATVVGCMEALRQVQQKARRQEHRSRKNNLVVHCTKSSCLSPAIEGRHVVLSGNKVRIPTSRAIRKRPMADIRGQLYIDTGTQWDVPFGHPACCFYHPFPGIPGEGLVTTICDDPPIM